MFTVNVYKSDILVDVKQILYGFTIVDNLEGELYWETDEEARENMRHRHDPNRKRGGVQAIRYMGGGMIRLVSPEWELWVNGKQCERGYYNRLLLDWRKMDLVFGPYRFEFLQPELEGQEPAELPRPRQRMSPEDSDIDD